ncbi:hypothetical protein ACS0TY_022581 [Phlomoides rotata]
MGSTGENGVYKGDKIGKAINEAIMGEGVRRRAKELSEKMRMEEERTEIKHQVFHLISSITLSILMSMPLKMRLFRAFQMNQRVQIQMLSKTFFIPRLPNKTECCNKWLNDLQSGTVKVSVQHEKLIKAYLLSTTEKSLGKESLRDKEIKEN